MSNKTVKNQLMHAESIYEQAHSAHSITAATDVLQLVSDGMWEFGKIKKPSIEQIGLRQKLSDAIDVLQVKDELLGTFEGASAQERRAYVLSLTFANKEKHTHEEKIANALAVNSLQVEAPALA